MILMAESVKGYKIGQFGCFVGSVVPEPEQMAFLLEG